MAALRAKVQQGDCVEVFSNLPAALEAAGMPAMRPKLGIADSPYNYGQDYEAYRDRLKRDEFLSWSKTWIRALHNAMHEHGSIWIFAPDEWVSEIDIFCRYELQMHKRRQVVWYFTFGNASQNNFSKSHVHLLYMTMHPRIFTFNADAVRVPSARQLVYNDKRQNPKGKMPDDTWLLVKEQMADAFPPDVDTWLESRVCGTFKERNDFSPNQIPIPVMSRIVRACATPGDLVVDPFCGTGSSGKAALAYGCHYFATDLSGVCAHEAQTALDRLTGAKK
jgi:DNA modification methylase